MKIKKLLFVLSSMLVLTSCEIDIFNPDKPVIEEKTEYFIEYYVDDELYSSQKATIKEEVSLLEMPVRDGYTFEGWYLTNEYSGDKHSTYSTFTLPKDEITCFYGYYKTVFVPVSENVEILIDTINSLPQYDEITETDINDIERIYKSLSQRDQGLVTNYGLYLNAKAAYTKYKNLNLNSLETKQEALYNAAIAYTDKLTKFQYDQYTSRRNLGCTPEDGNTYMFTYMDCSGFCNNVYRYVFDECILSGNINVSTASVETYCSQNIGKSNDVIFFADLSKIEKTAEKALEIKAMLEPGDLYCYRHGSAGHIMLYVGKGLFVHSTGTAGLSTANALSQGPYNRTSEDTTSHERNYGTLCIDDVDIVFDSKKATSGVGGTSNRYIFNSSNTSAMILRPLNRNLTLSKAGIDRLVYPRLEIEKSNNVNNFTSVKKNDVIDYTVNIKNNDTDVVKYVTVTETIPEGVEVTNTNGNIKDNKITWVYSTINPSQNVIATYSYKVIGEVGDRILDIDTKVNNLRTNMLENDIKANINLSNLDLTKLSKKYEYGSELMIDLYKSINVDLTKYFTKTDYIVDKFYDAQANKLGNDIEDIVPAILCGGINARRYHIGDNDQVRNLLPSYLENGDIVCAEFNGSYETFIYLNKQIYKHTSGSDTIETINSSNTTSYLHTIPYYLRYVVIRPSLIK